MKKKVGTWDVVISTKKVTLTGIDPRVVFTFDYPIHEQAKELYKKITTVKMLKRIVKDYVNNFLFDSGYLYYR